MEIDVAVERTRNPRPKPVESEYGFGRFFTDHIFQVAYESKRGWHQPRISPYHSISLDPAASVLHYGQALFEGMKAFRGVDGKIRLFRPDKNWQRLQVGAERLCMKAPDFDLFMASLKSLVRADADWVPHALNTALYLRPTLIGTEAFLGVRPSESYLYYVIASPVGAYYGEGHETIRIWVEHEYSRCAPGGIGAIKAGGNYASSLLAATEAKKRGFAQVLWLDAGSRTSVEEVGTMNVFFVIGDEIITPPLSGTILPGVVRDSVIELLQQQGKNIRQRRLGIDEIVAAHQKGLLREAFGTGTAAGISPIGALGVGKNILEINHGKIGAISNDLFNRISDIQYGRTADDTGWTVVVEPA